MITYKDCPECGARKIHSTVSVCEVCETWAKAEQRLADEREARKAAEREIAELKARIVTLEAMK